MKRWAAIALLSLPTACASAQQSEADLAVAWETSSPNFIDRNCSYLERARYVVVPTEQRDAALHALQDRPFVALDDTNIGFRPETPPGLHAYLVRAVSKFQSTTFVVRDCGDLLFVMNGSLGRGTPPSSRMPIVVMLEDAPTELAVGWSIAE